MSFHPSRLAYNIETGGQEFGKVNLNDFAYYVLLGVGVRTTLVILTTESVTAYSTEYLDDL